jgi:hypothetical protein
MNTLSLKKYFESSLFRKVLYAIGIIIVALFIFQVGIFVGYRKAHFAYRFGDNYYRTFGNPRHMIDRRIDSKSFFDAHGATGKIIDITLPTLVIESPDNVEKIIVIKNDTVIRRFRDSVLAHDLQEGDFIVVFGSPNDQSQIEARLIRIMPSSPQTETTN